MKIYIGFEELSRQIKERFGQDVAFGKISDRDLRVTYRKKALIVTIPVSVDLTLTEVKPESVALKYHMFVGLDQIISMVMKAVVGKHPDLKDAIHIDGDTVAVNLDEIDNAKAFTQNFAIKEVHFDDGGVNVELDFKTVGATPDKEPVKKKDEADRDEIAEVKELLAEQKEEEAAVEKADKQRANQLMAEEQQLMDEIVGKDKKHWIPAFKGKLKAYADKFTPNGLMEKISKSAKEMGVKLVYYILLLFYGLKDGKIPTKDKLLVMAALGYVILPLDFVPDFIVAGFLDDVSVVTFVLRTVFKSITPEIKEQALQKLREWFPVEKAPELTLLGLEAGA